MNFKIFDDFYLVKYVIISFETFLQAEDAVCLADYCDIMRCQVLVAHGLLSGVGGPVTDIEVCNINSYLIYPIR